jgi:hypothetical protein
MFAITTRTAGFTPTFKVPGGGPSVTLGSHFGDIEEGSADCAAGARRFHYSERTYLGNPGFYQTYVYAYNDAGAGSRGEATCSLTPEPTRESNARANSAPDARKPDASTDAAMVMPGRAALTCTKDMDCGFSRCNALYGKCAFPCAHAEADCVPGARCLAGFCVPSVPDAGLEPIQDARASRVSSDAKAGDADREAWPLLDAGAADPFWVPWSGEGGSLLSQSMRLNLTINTYAVIGDIFEPLPFQFGPDYDQVRLLDP